MDKDMTPPDLESVRGARARIAPHVVETPTHLWRGPELEARVGAETSVVLKLELFQRAGSFKARGAVASLMALDAPALARGVTAVSAGNHAIATAYAAARLGASAKVVMMASANPARVALARSLGAEVLISPTGAEAFALAARIEAEEGRAFIHPFEGREVALGTATLGLEFSEQAGPLDAVIIPIGGGGLCAGVGWAFKAVAPGCVVYGVEPVGADTMHRSFAAGSPQPRADVATIADSLAPPYALPYSYGLCRDNVDRLVMIDDDQMVDAMGVLFREMKLAVEPAAAAATAALFGPLRDELAGKRVGVIVCGANIDLATFHALLSRPAAALPAAR
jgi:threonine dehydratase